ncbi:lectin BRA-3-like [Amphibalanus amphitrite]|uniref:lectin BRA-3-like n=1 Tax=Amphibalanus amphitrite TaxID=1232801 RepID=UPI001C9082F8|nr:lectin BRA-3-like [Amphibalanus amphitrite]
MGTTLIKEAVLLAVATFLAAAACPTSDWAQYGNSCYWLSDFQLEWRSVSSDCGLVQPGSKPVSVHDLEAHAFLAELTEGNGTWLGLHRASTTAGWTWSDGSPFDWEFWRSDQPDGDGERCAFMNCDSHGEWCTADCADGFYYFLCQIDA